MNKLAPCESCNMNFCHSEKICPFCDFPTAYSSKNKNISKISCPKCSFQNDLSNTMCVACDSFLDQKDEQKSKCEHCGQMVLKKFITQHSTNCYLSLEMIKSQKVQQEPVQLSNEIKCRYCSLNFPQDLIKQHNQVCVSKPKPLPVVIKPIVKPIYPKPKPKPGYFGGFGGLISKPIKQSVVPVVPFQYEQIIIPQQIKEEELFEQAELARLTKLQKNAILYMQAKSLKAHKITQKQLQKKTGSLGYKKAQLENLLFYIQNYAPIIIHIHITRHMEFFIKDTHYRNQFQTGKSSGSLSRQSRIQWENRMFDKKYSSATDHQRVKYGVINFTNDPKGVNCALGYGQSYFLLKQHVRNRCTMTDMDSSSASSLIGTFKFCFHILNKMNNLQLKSAFNAAKALQQSSTVTTTYKQIQIHGPIQFAKDIQRIYVNKNEVKDKKFLDMVYAFCEKNKVQYEFI